MVQSTVRFRFDGQPISENDTPKGLDMEDGDTIEVFQQQTGGASSQLLFPDTFLSSNLCKKCHISPTNLKHLYYHNKISYHNISSHQYDIPSCGLLHLSWCVTGFRSIDLYVLLLCPSSLLFLIYVSSEKTHCLFS